MTALGTDLPQPIDLLARLQAAAGEGLAANLSRFLHFLGWQAGEVLELQALRVPANKAAGRWRETAAMAAHASTLPEMVRLCEQAEGWGAQGVYVILNLIKPAVQSRRGPGAWHEVPKGEGTKDGDIQKRRVLYLDLDPERADGVRGISATQDELAVAVERATRLRDLLLRFVPEASVGVGLSGNGCALFVALEPTAPEGEIERLIKAVLVTAHLLLSDDRVKVDVSVSDPKRLGPALGTIKRKGAPSPERPHRRSAFLGPSKPSRLGLAELQALVVGLREELPSDEARAAIDRELALPSTKGRPSQTTPAPPVSQQRPVAHETTGKRQSDKSEAFHVANEIPVGSVLAKLGLGDTEQPTCPGCGESDKGVAVVGNGLKCQHNRCSTKGVRDGFRTVVDLVIEREGTDAAGALDWLRAAFPEAGIPERRRHLGKRHTAVQASASPRAANDEHHEQDEGKPGVVVDHRIGHRVRQVETILAGLPELPLFVRDGVLVTVGEAGTRKGWRDDTRTPVPRAISLAALRALLSDKITFQRWSGAQEGRSLVACRPSDDITKALHQATEWPELRELVGVVRSPYLATLSGDVATSSGYDARTGYLLRLPEGAAPVLVPDQPTRDDAQQALALLRDELLADFPFATERDRTVAVAAILTLLARPALGRHNVPGYVVEAPVKNTGKTLLTDAIGVAGTGAPIAKHTFPTSDEELTKTIFSVAFEARQAVCFDNLNVPLGGDALDGVITCGGRYAGRVLGKSATEECSWRTTLFFNGNNVLYRGDIGRRVLICRLDARTETPSDRGDYRHADLLSYALAHQPQLAAAGLTILRAFARSPKGERPAIKPLGSFEAWTQIVAAALCWLGLPNPCEAIPDASAETPDPARAALRMLLATWNDLEHHPRIQSSGGWMSGQGCRAQAVIEALYPLGQPAVGDEPSYRDLRGAIEGMVAAPSGRSPSGRTLGTALAKIREQRADGRRLVGSLDRKGVLLWRVVTDSPSGR